MSQQTSSLETGTAQASPQPGIDPAASTGSAMDTAREAAKSVSEPIKDTARSVSDTAMSQTKSVVSEIGGELRNQASDQKSRLAQVLRDLSDELDGVQTPEDGRLHGLASEAATRTRDVSTWLEQTEPEDMLRAAEDFARRRPMTFLLAAAAAGVVVGRLTRGIASAVSEDREERTERPYVTGGGYTQPTSGEYGQYDPAGTDPYGKYRPAGNDEYSAAGPDPVIDITDTDPVGLSGRSRYEEPM